MVAWCPLVFTNILLAVGADVFQKQKVVDIATAWASLYGVFLSLIFFSRISEARDNWKILFCRIFCCRKIGEFDHDASLLAALGRNDSQEDFYVDSRPNSRPGSMKRDHDTSFSVSETSEQSNSVDL